MQGIYVVMYVCMYGWKDGEMHTGLHARMDGFCGKINIQMDKEVHTCVTYIYTYVSTYMHAYIHTLRTYTHTPIKI
jgi:hypothetical protein